PATTPTRRCASSWTRAARSSPTRRSSSSARRASTAARWISVRTKRNSLVLALALASGVASAQKPSVEIAVLREELLLPDAARARGAVDKLRRARGAAATDALLDALALGLSPRVALAALDALRERRASAALDVLIRYAHHRDAVARAAATSALGALDDRRA